MLKFIFALSVLMMAPLTWADSIPVACDECMSQCPHATKDIKPCDRGCPDACSKDQAQTWRETQAYLHAGDECYKCMSQCPHASRDEKACDQEDGCNCDLQSMRKAFLKANEIAKHCGSGQPSNNKKGGNEGISR